MTRGGGIEQGGEHRFARPHLRIARALVLLPVDHLETVLAGEVLEIRKRDQRVEEGRERRMAGLAGLLFAAHIAIEPDMEPVRGIFGDDAGQRSRIRRADQDQAALLQRFAEAEKRRFDIGKMLDDVVADHEIETAGREAIGLDVAENRLLRIVIVADLVLVDIDHRDMRRAAIRQAAGNWSSRRRLRRSQGGSAAASCRECRERRAGSGVPRRAAGRAAIADARPATRLQSARARRRLHRRAWRG